MKAGAISGAVATVLFTVSANAQIPGSTREVAGWTVAAYEHSQRGGFSHCGMYATYHSGISMHFSVFENFTWAIGWSHQAWNFKPGQQVDVVLHVDGVGPYVVRATARTKTFASASLPDKGGVFDLMRRGYRMTAVAEGNSYAFKLDGTYAALTDTVNCVAKYTGQAQAPAPASTPAPIVSTPRASPPATLSQTALEQRLEATKVVANILAQGEMTGFSILSAKEIADLKSEYFSGSDVVWRAEGGIFGTLRILPKSKYSSAEQSAAVLADDARGCKGAFVSGSSADDKNPKVLRMFTGCQTKSEVHECRYTLVPLSDGTTYLFATAYITDPGSPKGKAQATESLLRQAVYQVMKQ